MRGDVEVVAKAAQVGLFFALFCNAVGQSFLNVVLPPLGRLLGFTDMETGTILSVSALLLILTAPIWGYASERIGRRPVLLLALSAAIVAPLLFALIIARSMDGTLATGLTLILLLSVRSLQTIASSGFLPASQAYIADTTPVERRAKGMGIIGAAYGFGAVAGAALAWLVAGRSVPAAFSFIGALSGLALVYAIFAVKEPRICRRPEQDALTSLRR